MLNAIVNLSRLGIVPGVIKFICHILWGYFAFTKIGYYKIVNSHAELKPPHFSQNLVVGEGIVAIIGILGFIWNFITWIPSFFRKNRLLQGIIGAGDLALDAILWVGIGYQSTYVPSTPGPCRDALTWQGAPYNQSIYAILANNTRFTTEDGRHYHVSPQATCKSFVTCLYIAGTVGVLYFFSATFGLLASCNGDRSYSRQSYGTRPRQYKRARAQNFGRSILGFISSTIIQPVVLSTRIVARTLFSTRTKRVSRKRDSKAKQTEKGQSDILLLKDPGITETGPPPPYEDTFTRVVRANLAMLAPKLHYSDMYNLSRTSKSLRRALLSSVDADKSHETLRVLSCVSGSKAHCWACHRQICSDCTESISKPATDVARHRVECEPYCSKCFMVHTYQRGDIRIKSCECVASDAVSSTTYHARSAWPLADRANRVSVCRNCKRLSSADLRATREVREASDLARLYAQGVMCQRCSRSLNGKTLRWWACQTCGLECRSKLHPKWAEEDEA